MRKPNRNEELRPAAVPANYLLTWLLPTIRMKFPSPLAMNLTVSLYIINTGNQTDGDLKNLCACRCFWSVARSCSKKVSFARLCGELESEIMRRKSSTLAHCWVLVVTKAKFCQLEAMVARTGIEPVLLNRGL